MLAELRSAHQKYKYIEAELVQRKRRLAFKQPEIRKCLEAVKMLQSREEEGEAVRRVWSGGGVSGCAGQGDGGVRGAWARAGLRCEHAHCCWAAAGAAAA